MATSTISYISRRGTTPGKKKSSGVGGSAAQQYQVTPLFFQETMEANTSSYRLNTVGEDDASLSFEQPSELDAMGGDVSARSRQSNISGVSSSTFRDTPVDQEDAGSMMHAQSLSSIVNNPKKDSLLRKMKNMVKQKVTGTA